MENEINEKIKKVQLENALKAKKEEEKAQKEEEKAQKEEEKKMRLKKERLAKKEIERVK